LNNPDQQFTTEEPKVENKNESIFLKLYAFSSSWTGTIIIVLFLIFFVAQAFVIPSGSMKNTMLIGDMLFAKKFAYGIPTPRIPWLEIPVLPDFNNNGHLIEGERPKRGDIVIFRYPNNEKIHYVKRCVATQGDLVMLRNKVLYIRYNETDEYIKANFPKERIVKIENDLWVANPYQHKYKGIHNDIIQNFPQELVDFGPVEIPDDEYFMMGDNRDHSNDSRFWGSVKYKYIVGKPWFVYFSWDENYKIRWDRMFRTVDDIAENTK
jgi:signal peptidase I